MIQRCLLMANPAQSEGPGLTPMPNSQPEEARGSIRFAVLPNQELNPSVLTIP